MAKKYKYRKDFTIDGKRYTVYANTKHELIEKETRKRIAIENDDYRVDSNMLLRDWAYQCVETYKTNQKEVTRQKYVSRMNHCILEPIGDMRLKDIKPLHCQNVMNLQTGNSRTQINEVYQTLLFLFKHAVANRLLKSNPAEHIVKPKYEWHHRRALTANEREHCEKVGRTDRRYYYFLLMLYCGCRPGEAAAVTGSDLRILSNGIPALHIRGTKTDNADRVVPVPQEFYDLIKCTPADEAIAMTARGPVTENNRTRIWESFKRQLNISMGCKVYRNALIPPYPLAPDLVPYCLRHEYCTELARRGIDIRIAQKLMGHSDIKLTANIYTNLNDDDIADIAELLAEKGTAPGTALKEVKRGKNGVPKKV